MLKENFGVIFNGNGYSLEWQVEAAKRGLANLKNGIEAVDKLDDAKNVELLERMSMMSELLARKSVLFDANANILTIKASTMVQMICAKRSEIVRGN